MSVVDAQEDGVTFSDDEKTVDLFDILKDEFDTNPKMVIGSVAEGMENLYISYNDAKYLLNTEKEGIQVK